MRGMRLAAHLLTAIIGGGVLLIVAVVINWTIQKFLGTAIPPCWPAGIAVALVSMLLACLVCSLLFLAVFFVIGVLAQLVRAILGDLAEVPARGTEEAFLSQPVPVAVTSQYEMPSVRDLMLASDPQPPPAEEL